MTMKMRRLLSVILCVLLIAALAFNTIGCSSKKQGQQTHQTAEQDVQQSVEQESQQTAEQDNSPKTVGEGEKQFNFVVVDKDGNETEFIVNTDEETVGKALLDLGLIEGEDGQYGLYVKKVNGIVADYDVDQTYWGFFIDGEFASTGVDSTNIEAGRTYTFKVSK